MLQQRKSFSPLKNSLKAMTRLLWEASTIGQASIPDILQLIFAFFSKLRLLYFESVEQASSAKTETLGWSHAEMIDTHQGRGLATKFADVIMCANGGHEH